MSAVPLRLGTIAPAAGFVSVSMGEANGLLSAWGHYLGPCGRPFRSEGWALDVGGEPVAVAVSSSIVSEQVTVDGRSFGKTDCVELARLCSRPDSAWATRVMLRLWREVAAPAYACWTPLLAVAYSQNARHDGRLYRFDGWTLVREDAGSSGGGAWSRRRYAGDASFGCKRLWVWRYPPGLRDSARE